MKEPDCNHDENGGSRSVERLVRQRLKTRSMEHHIMELECIIVGNPITMEIEAAVRKVIRRNRQLERALSHAYTAVSKLGKVL